MCRVQADVTKHTEGDKIPLVESGDVPLLIRYEGELVKHGSI
jgi:hypothetical protein